MNLNTDLYYDKDSDFKQACELSEKEFSHSEMIKMLKNGNIQQKQIAALLLDNINTEEEGEILIGNLTGCDGKIREAVALKINQLLISNPNLSKFFNYPNIFANASIDINANICRVVIDSISVMKKLPDFKEKYIEILLGFIKETYAEIDKFIFRDKKYVINKQLFKLYWCLESLKLFINDIESDKMLAILKRASDEKEYTIREKAAQILKLLDDEIYKDIKEKLSHDENYYVRKAISDK